MKIDIDATMDAVDAADVTRLARQVGLHPGVSPVGSTAREPGAAAAPGIGVEAVAPGAVRIRGKERTYRLPLDGAALAVDLAALEAQRDPGRGHLLCVSAVSGGLGATTLAAVLAATALERGEPAALVEADPVPGGAAALLGLPEGLGMRWADLAISGPLVPHRLLASLPRWRDVPVLCGGGAGFGAPGGAGGNGGMGGTGGTGSTRGTGAGGEPRADGGTKHEVVRDAVEALRRTRSLVVLDLPRHLLVEAEFAQWRPDSLVVLVAPTPESLAAASALRAQLAAVGAPAPRWIVRRTTRPPVPEWYLDAALGDAAETALTLGRERGLAEAVDAGDGPWLGRRGPLRATAARLLDAIDRVDRPAGPVGPAGPAGPVGPGVRRA